MKILEKVGFCKDAVGHCSSRLPQAQSRAGYPRKTRAVDAIGHHSSRLPQAQSGAGVHKVTKVTDILVLFSTRGKRKQRTTW